MKQSVLISGGSGLVGRYLTSLLLSEGHGVAHLSRNSNSFGKVRVYRWDPAKGILDSSVFGGISAVVHLAGANIGEKRWSRQRRMEIRESRTVSARLIRRVMTESGNFPQAFISASATGYYGSLTSERIFSEDDGPANDFLGNICREWEEEALLFGQSGIRTVSIRSGVVLERNDSALKKMLLPSRFGFLARTGSGKQYMPWIHIHDIAGIYLKAIVDDTMSGSYNAVAPAHVTHREFIDTLARVAGRPVLPVNVPAFILRQVLGEMADVVLNGSRVSSARIQAAGYEFRFPELREALSDVLRTGI
ncbi:MAG: TIGR01777 family oxidoreductase [Bacteroidales bacterium]|jgi:hypothetical protein|nr:TIGR01777 family oxidoreductase [Bacteroidales bacterium]MCU0407396.1 TIGR01777 family oxidoreductase [Bacteroidales bacterium]